MPCRLVFRIALAVSLAFTFTAPAASAHAGEGETRSDPSQRPLLWRLSEGGSTVYLLGSFHLLREDDYPLAPEVERAFDDAERVVFEVAPSDLESSDTVRRTLDLARLGDDGRLRELVPEPLAAKLEKQLALHGSSLSRMDRFEPWFVNVTLSVGISRGLGYRWENGLDRYLMTRAANAGKPIVGLETVDSQLRALKETPLSEQLATLKSLVEAPEAMRGAFERLHRAWRSGDVEALEALTHRPSKAVSPESFHRINTQRNEKWLPLIRDLLARPPGEDALVVVGSMHLVGEDGLIRMLQRRGLAAERVRAGEVDVRVAASF